MKRVINVLLIIVLMVLVSCTSVDASSNKSKYKMYARELVTDKYHWSNDNYKSLVKLWNKESGWRVHARNGIYYGIPQTNIKNYGKNYNSYKVQIKVGLKYIKKRYGSPNKAWRHFQIYNWY